MSKEVRFDWVLNGKDQGIDPVFDVDLFPAGDFAVVPTMGSLVPGWLLLIPRQKMLSLSLMSIDQQNAVLKCVRELSPSLKNFGDRAFMFEHGALRSNTLTGCGVDQAHLHLVPLDFDLINYVIRSEDNIEWKEVSPSSPWEKIDNNRSYYLISDSEKAYIGYVISETSQFFRRKIAAGLGHDHAWDYKTHPHPENALKTIENYVRFYHRANAA